MLLADPITSTTAPGHVLGARTGLGLTAFYLTLLVVLTGFIGANIVSNGVDAALGYAPSELGPRRRMRAVPGFYRGLALFEPMRQITGGVRAIIYFDARADAGLERAWLMLCVGLVIALLLGLGVTQWYDRRGPHRIHPDELVGPSAP